MFRALLAAAVVVLAFGVALFKSGDLLKSWETPEVTSARAAPAAKKKTKRKHSARRRHAPRPRRSAEAPWLAQLNALCRRGQRQAAEIPVPLTPEGMTDYFHQLARLNTRWNLQAIALLEKSSASDQAAARELVRQLQGEEDLMATFVSAIERGQTERIEELRPLARSVSKAENRLMKKLGARDCTAGDPFAS